MSEEKNQTSEKETEQETTTPEEEIEEEKSPQETPEESGGEGEPESEPKEEISQPPADEVDYKKKFTESAKEAQILLERNKQLEAKLGQVTKEETPTEEEMKKIYPNWDIDYSPAEQEILRKNVALEQRLNKLHLTVSQLEEERGWSKRLDNFLEKMRVLGKYSGLKGKEEEFKKFCQKPTHRGIDFEVLAKAFLYETPMKKEEKLKDGQLVERGSGGPKAPQKPKKGYTPEDLALLRKTDYKKYKKIIAEHPEIELEE